MQKNGMLLIVVMLVSIGLLSGCIEQRAENGDNEEDQKARITVINHFTGDVTGHIRVEAYSEDDSYDASQTVTVKSGETKIVWFDTPESLYRANYYPTFTAVYVYDHTVTDTVSGWCYGHGTFHATFMVRGSPPNIEVEHQSS